MYSAIMTGIANHLRNHWGKYKDEKDYVRVNYGSTDSFWNKFNLDRLTLPGIIYASSSISYPRGLTGKTSSVRIGTNTSNTAELVVSVIPITIEISLGMLGKDEEQHFFHIEKYIELGAKKATIEYPVIFEGTSDTYMWLSSLSNFSELSPPPSGKEFSTYDPEGQLYPLEATFTTNTNILVTSEKKLIRAIYSNVNVGDSTSTSILTLNTDDETTVVRYELTENSLQSTKEKQTWEKMTRKTK